MIVIAKYPDFYGATILRNPVITVPELASTSDIPDWSYAQFGIPYDAPSPGFVSKELFEKLQEASPITYADKIKAPVLLFLGEDDQRVPNSQGKALYHFLKGANKKVEMLVFPKNGHALDKVEAARVGWLKGLNWFREVAQYVSR
jgi:dipeptidyl aminopeptidase/acylaminoacyl peptidase